MIFILNYMYEVKKINSTNHFSLLLVIVTFEKQPTIKIVLHRHSILF